MYDSLSDHDYDNTCQSGEIFFSRRNFEKKKSAFNFRFCF